MSLKAYMVGDLVQAERFGESMVVGYDNVNDKVVVSRNGCTLTTSWVSISPILITAKILKENFKLVEDWDDLYRISGSICYDFEHSVICDLINDLAYPICEVSYIHQLQQFLRICKLIELAENFKVE